MPRAHVRDQSKFQREVQVSRDKLLEEFEAENEQLLADLRRSRANLAALHEQTANEARARARAEGEIAGDVLHAQVTELKARLAAQSDELGAAQNRALCAEVHVEESELLAQDESVLRAAAEAKLEMLVTDIEQEESRMLEEIELLKVTIEDKDGAHRLTVQNMAMEIELLHENEEVLNLKIVKMNRGSTQNRAPGIKGKVDTDSLASELASKAKTAEAKLATELEQAKEALAAAKQLHATAAQVAEKAAKKAAAENKAFGDEVSALKGELGSLETTISTLKEERIALQALLNKAEAAVFAKDLERTTSADAAAAFKATVAGATQRASKRLSAAQADLKCKESEVASLKPRIKELTTELNTTIVASKKVDSELSAAQAEATLLKAKVGALESELAATKASLKSTKDAAAANGQSADETTAALKAARATEAKLTSDLEQSKAVLADSIQVHQAAAAAAIDAAHKSDAGAKVLRGERDTIKEHASELEVSVSSMQEKYGLMQATLAETNENLSSEQAEIKKGAKVLAELQKSSTAAQHVASKRLSAAQADLKCKESEVASLKPRIKELTTELNTTIVASKKVDSELSAAQAEATLLKAKVGALESELAATKASLKSTKDAAAANGQSADETTAALKAARATEAKLTSDLEQSKAVLADSVKAGKSLAATLETKVGSLVSELTATKLSLQSTADAAAAKGKSADATAIALKSAKAAEATLTSDLAAATDALASASEAAQKVQASAAKAAKRSGEENGKLATELTSTRAKLEAVTIAVSNHHHHLQSFAKANAELKESLAEALANGVAKAAEAHAAAEASARMIASMEERIAKLTEKSAASDVEVAKLKAKAEGAHAATVDAAFTAVLATKEVESLQVQLTKANTDVQSANAKLETMKKTVSANTELLKTAEKTRDAATETATQLSIDQSKAASVLTSAEMELCLMKELVSDLQSDLSAARELTAAAETSLKAREESAAAEKEKKRIAEAKIEFAKAAAAAAKASSLAAAKAEDERRAAIEQTNESEIKSVETGWKKEPVAAIVPCVPTETSYLRGPLLHPDGSVTRDMRPRVWHGVVDVQQLDVHTQELSKPTLEVCTDGNSLPLHNLCILIERLFYHGFVTTPDFFSFSKRRDPWDFLTVALKSEGIADAVNASKSVTTSVGRFRLFVRWALVQQRLAEYVQIAFAAQPVAMKFYDQAALLLRSETMMTVERALYALTGTFSFHPEVYVSAKDNSFSLDADWPCPTSRLVHRDI